MLPSRVRILRDQWWHFFQDHSFSWSIIRSHIQISPFKILRWVSSLQCRSYSTPSYRDALSKVILYALMTYLKDKWVAYNSDLPSSLGYSAFTKSDKTNVPNSILYFSNMISIPGYPFINVIVRFLLSSRRLLDLIQSLTISSLLICFNKFSRLNYLKRNPCNSVIVSSFVKKKSVSTLPHSIVSSSYLQEFDQLR